jgi:D-lactate dehydrogenase (cytochrome)
MTHNDRGDQTKITTPASASSASVSSAFRQLRTALGDRASNSQIIREQHSHGESYHKPALPDIVCFPHTTEEVSVIISIAAEQGLPVIPFGAGTSLEGHVNAIHGGVTVCLREMNHILQISREDLYGHVQAGVTQVQLNKTLQNTGLTFFMDPGAECTIGGMAATGASGTMAVRYGTMRDNVLGLTIVLADGRIIRSGTKARKSCAGYDLTRLFIGSEGTLGVITEAILRLHPIPEAVSAAVCGFQTIRGAVETVIATIQMGVPIARVELLDEPQVDAINRYGKTNYSVAPTLFFEFHGDNTRHVAEQVEIVQALSEEHGGSQFVSATLLEEREKMWKARHNAYYAALALRPGCRAMITDVCVPISQLAECIAFAKDDHAKAPFPVTLVGHVGDGNFHMIYMLDPRNPAELQTARVLSESMVNRALSLGGTCSGEHGIGLGKMRYLQTEHGDSLEVMRAIKQSLDPDNRLNPGKLIPS